MDGKIIKWKEKVSLHGLMEEFIKVNMLMIRKKVMENLPGLMEDFIKDNGPKVSNMVMESITLKKELKKEPGLMVKELLGNESRF